MPNEFTTIRIRFSKTGRAKYISHLDLNRTMTRVLRRAHIPLWYTEGFNRHPYITFAAPLSLGVESDSERMDLRLVEPMEMGALCAALNEAMPEGLRVSDAAPAVQKAGNLGFARYRIMTEFPLATVRAFLAQPSVVVQKKTKKGTYKDVELKQSIRDLTMEEQEGKTMLELTLPCSSSDTVNPTLLCEALRVFADAEDWLPQIRRLELYDADGHIFL